MSGEPSVKDGKRPASPLEGNPPMATMDGLASPPQHQTAIAALGSLPFNTVVSLFRHQWHKDKARITFAHAEQYMREYNQPTLYGPAWHLKTRYCNCRSKHQKQLRLLGFDLIRHRERFIELYSDAVIASSRLPKREPLTPSEARGVRQSLVGELRVSIPNDLTKVYLGKLPACMDVAIDIFECRDVYDYFSAERHPMILAVPIALHLWSRYQDYPDLLPKYPAPWDWTMPADVIEASHWKFKEDLL
ncbi:hypothetical protein GGR52DRAFT_586945 [Hypoxylon sp. FL1284]|nr:hypothetical protein GGR52DRAFT_586945 [Hypoxylon sp. FL1284]